MRSSSTPTYSSPPRARKYSTLLQNPAMWKVAFTPPVALAEELKPELMEQFVIPNCTKSCKPDLKKIIAELRDILRELYYLITCRDHENAEQFLPHIALTVIYEAMNNQVIKGNRVDAKGHHLKCVGLNNRIVNFLTSSDAFLGKHETDLKDIAITKFEFWEDYLNLHLLLIDRSLQILKERWPEKAKDLEEVVTKKRPRAWLPNQDKGRLERKSNLSEDPEDRMPETTMHQLAEKDDPFLDREKVAELTEPHGSTPHHTPTKMTEGMRQFCLHLTSPTESAQKNTTPGQAQSSCPAKRAISPKVLF